MVTEVTTPLKRNLKFRIGLGRCSGCTFASPTDRLRTDYNTMHAMAFPNAIVRPSPKVDSKNDTTHTFFQPA
jgi:hypothetical protein